jgi:GT2 family glycosyltransferase
LAKIIAEQRRSHRELGNKDDTIGALRQQLAEGHRELGNKDDTIGALRQQLAELSAAQQERLAGLTRSNVDGRIPSRLMGWRWLPPGRRKKQRRLVRDYRLIAGSPLFDREWYLQENHDVTLQAEDPALHYLLYGGPEGRRPGPDFDAGGYLKANPDVAATGVNPLLHYLLQGRHEGRRLTLVDSRRGPAASQSDQEIAYPCVKIDPCVSTLNDGALRRETVPEPARFPELAPTNVPEPATLVERTTEQPPAIPVVKLAARAVEIDYSLAVPLRYIVESRHVEGAVAAVVHMFYGDLAVEFRSYLENIPGAVDVFISVANQFDKALVEDAFADWGQGGVEVRIVPNRGRDVAPRLVEFRDVYNRYALVLQLHTKRSIHSPVLTSWRHFLLENLVGNEAVVSSVFEAFARNPRLGIVAAQHFEPVRNFIDWGNNLGLAKQLTERIGITIDPDAALDFPSGSMFWVRTAALRPLLDLGLTAEEFGEEQGKKDQTLAHAIERLQFHVCEHAGFDWIKIARPELFTQTPGIISVRDASELDRFFERYVFRVSDPKEVRARIVQPMTISEPARALLDAVRDHALGCGRVIADSARVAVGIVTYDNEDAVLRLGANAARLALEKAGLSTSRSLWVLDNGRVSEVAIPADEAVVRLPNQGNIGFGAGHNALMRAAFGEGANVYVAVNPDGMLHPDAIGALVRAVQAHSGRALVEALQFPIEHPKSYDPETLDTPWVSGACLALPRQAFNKLNGFDESFFMYCEDVDLSWRARACGFALKTCPQALFLHTVTNREENLRRRAMIFASGVILARKWGSVEFEDWLRCELAALGATIPGVAPLPVPEEWRRYADFAHHFSFAETRW